jgi:hypothetical protein
MVTSCGCFCAVAVAVLASTDSTLPSTELGR